MALVNLVNNNICRHDMTALTSEKKKKNCWFNLKKISNLVALKF